MSQASNAIHTSEDGASIFIPCSCGDDGDRITFTHFPGDKDDPISVGVTIEGGHTWRYRIASAWRALRDRTHRDSVGLSYETTRALSAWLAEKAASAEGADS